MTSCDGEDGGVVSPWQLAVAAAASGLPLGSTSTSSLTSSESWKDEQLWRGAVGLADERATSISQI